MYESPIEKIFGEIYDEFIRKDEEHLMTVVSQSVGYVVDKTELVKALQYDRQQYEKGYADALGKVRAEIEKQEKWLMQVGYTACNVDIAFGIIKMVVESEEI